MRLRKYFGTDGIRGKVGDSVINPEFMLKLGWAIGKVLVKDKAAQVVIGRDTRISGHMLEAALQAGLSAAGVNSTLLGIIPTPAVAHLTHSLRASAGAVISASHNLYQDNGIKFFDSKGMKLSDEIEFIIEDHLEMPMKMVSSKQLGHMDALVDAGGRYIEFCKSIYPGQLTLRGLKLVIDCANGATFEVAPKIFHELGAEVITIHHQPDGLNINQHCGATNVRALQQKVTEMNADAGIAFDGDGDRLMMVDHRGELVDGDEILCILAMDETNGQKRKGIVGTVMSNLGLEQALASKNIEFTRTAVGDRYVLEELIKRNWKLGGEPSGHIVNLDYTTTGDGIITALQVLRIMQILGKKCHELKKGMIKRPQVLINVPIFGEKNLTQFPKVAKAVSDAEQKFNGKGRVLIRTSGTEACVRVMVEGNDEQTVRETAEQLASVVEHELT